MPRAVRSKNQVGKESGTRGPKAISKPGIKKTTASKTNNNVQPKKAPKKKPITTPSPSPPPPISKEKTKEKFSVKENPKENSRKRKGPSGPKPTEETKRLKLDFKNTRGVGVCLAVGQGDTGQLGLGESVVERTKPGLVKDLEGVIDVVAGGMHSVCLTKTGEVYTFGCNDEGSLGRVTDDEEEGFLPGKVEIPGKVIMISAGDSHSVCLTEDGHAFYWGTFRDSSGSFGLTPSGKIERLPVPLAHHLIIKKISSGADHVALLTTNGALYTLGCAEQGQLGRVGERFTARGGRRGLTLLLQPDKIHSRKRKTIFKDVWAGSYNTFVLSEDGDIMVCGLNNYNQLGVKNVNGQTFFSLVKSDSFRDNKWSQIALGQHHTLALDHEGKVYALGRNEYGRLGLGESVTDAHVPTLISGLAGKKIVDVSCGTAVSFAVSESGECFSWGMGTNGQLSHEDDSDSWSPEPMFGKQLESRKVLLASGGGQHTLLLAQ